MLSGASSDVLELACKSRLLASLAKPTFGVFTLVETGPGRSVCATDIGKYCTSGPLLPSNPPPPAPSSEEPVYTGDIYLSKTSSSLVLGWPILKKEGTAPLSGSSQPDENPLCLLEYFMVLNSVVYIIYLILTTISLQW